MLDCSAWPLRIDWTKSIRRDYAQRISAWARARGAKVITELEKSTAQVEVCGGQLPVGEANGSGNIVDEDTSI